jgi:hypothetical protein
MAAKRSIDAWKIVRGVLLTGEPLPFRFPASAGSMHSCTRSRSCPCHSIFIALHEFISSNEEETLGGDAADGPVSPVKQSGQCGSYSMSHSMPPLSFVQAQVSMPVICVSGVGAAVSELDTTVLGQQEVQEHAVDAPSHTHEEEEGPGGAAADGPVSTIKRSGESHCALIPSVGSSSHSVSYAFVRCGRLDA